MPLNISLSRLKNAFPIFKDFTGQQGRYYACNYDIVICCVIKEGMKCNGAQQVGAGTQENGKGVGKADIDGTLQC